MFCLLISCLCVWPAVDLIFHRIKKPSEGFEVLRSIIFTWEISYLFWMSKRSVVPAKVSVLRVSRHNVECCINIFAIVSSENETFGSFIICRHWASRKTGLNYLYMNSWAVSLLLTYRFKRFGILCKSYTDLYNTFKAVGHHEIKIDHSCFLRNIALLSMIYPCINLFFFFMCPYNLKINITSPSFWG